MKKTSDLVGALEPLGKTEIHVSSLVRAKRFYNRVFRRQAYLTDQPGRSAEYRLADSVVRLTAVENRHASGAVLKLRYRVDDFLYEYQRLQLLGVKQVGSVIESEQGEMSMNICDDDGNILTIVGDGALPVLHRRQDGIRPVVTEVPECWERYRPA